MATERPYPQHFNQNMHHFLTFNTIMETEAIVQTCPFSPVGPWQRERRVEGTRAQVPLTQCVVKLVCKLLMLLSVHLVHGCDHPLHGRPAGRAK